MFADDNHEIIYFIVKQVEKSSHSTAGEHVTHVLSTLSLARESLTPYVSFPTLVTAMKVMHMHEEWSYLLDLFEARRELTRGCYEAGDRTVFTMAIEAAEAFGNWQNILEILKDELLVEKPHPSPFVFETAVASLCNLRQVHNTDDGIRVMLMITI